MVLGHHQRREGFVYPEGAKEDMEKSNSKGDNMAIDGTYSF